MANKVFKKSNSFELLMAVWLATFFFTSNAVAEPHPRLTTISEATWRHEVFSVLFVSYCFFRPMSVHQRHSNFYWHFLYTGINTKVVACCRTFNYLIERADQWSNAINNLANYAAIACWLDISPLNTLFDSILWPTRNWSTSRWSKQLPSTDYSCWAADGVVNYSTDFVFLVDGDTYSL